MTEQLALLPGYLTAHLQLTLLSLLLGTAFSIPTGILVARLKWLDNPVLGTASVIQTIPSLALLAVMVPALAALGLRSIGFLPAFIGLTLYSILPILRNTVIGLASVDPALVEAARGVGMTPTQRLRHVELPLAMPVILAGIRTSTVLTVGVATLSTPVGAPSLGNYIFSGPADAEPHGGAGGLRRGRPSCAVSGRSGARARRGRRSPKDGLGCRCPDDDRPALYVHGGVADAGPARAGRRAGGRRRQNVHRAVHPQPDPGGTYRGDDRRRHGGRVVARVDSGVRRAPRGRDRLVYVDYSGTIWATIMHRDTATAGRDAVLDEVSRFVREEHGIEVAGALGFENAYALAMRRRQVEKTGIRQIGDLIAYARRLVIGGDYEFFGGRSGSPSETPTGWRSPQSVRWIPR